MSRPVHRPRRSPRASTPRSPAGRRSSSPPRRPAEPLANLSATLFAAGALRAAGVPASDPAIAKARAFVRRCQNFDGDGDGGFFASPVDPTLDKGGSPPGEDGRFYSYGS